jgi:hypothetical protein
MGIAKGGHVFILKLQHCYSFFIIIITISGFLEQRQSHPASTGLVNP